MYIRVRQKNLGASFRAYKKITPLYQVYIIQLLLYCCYYRPSTDRPEP